jgi:hypothetical protein
MQRTQRPYPFGNSGGWCALQLPSIGKLVPVTTSATKGAKQVVLLRHDVSKSQGAHRGRRQLLSPSLDYSPKEEQSQRPVWCYRSWSGPASLSALRPLCIGTMLVAFEVILTGVSELRTIDRSRLRRWRWRALRCRWIGSIDRRYEANTDDTLDLAALPSCRIKHNVRFCKKHVLAERSAAWLRCPTC